MNIALNPNFNFCEHGEPEIVTSLEAYYALASQTDTVLQQAKAVTQANEQAKKFSKSIFELNQIYLKATTKPTTRQQYDAVIQKYVDVIPRHLCKEILALKYASSKKDFTNYIHMRKLKLTDTMIATILSTKFLS
jgi:hypothetical protein